MTWDAFSQKEPLGVPVVTWSTFLRTEKKRSEKQPNAFRQNEDTNLISMTQFPQGCTDGEEIKSNTKDFSVQLLPNKR